jgi:hypothetical protein
MLFGRALPRILQGIFGTDSTFDPVPDEAVALGGNKLVCRAHHRLGTQTNVFSIHFCRPSLLAHSATHTYQHFVGT